MRALAALFVIAAVCLPVIAQTKSFANRFYAMDTSFQRPGSSLEQQIDIVKELGFVGVAWHEEAPSRRRPTPS